MASLDIETMVENAFIEVLGRNADVTAVTQTIRPWRKALESKEFPILLVHGDSFPGEGVDATREGGLLAGIVNIGCFTYGADDKRGDVIRALAGAVRGSLYSSTLLEELNTNATINIQNVTITGDDKAEQNNIYGVTFTLDVKVSLVFSRLIGRRGRF